MAKKRGPKPSGKANRVLVSIKVTPEYKAWLEGFAKAERDIPSRMIDLGLIELAKKLGHALPPER